MHYFEFPTSQVEHALAQSDEIETLEFSVYDSRENDAQRRLFRIEPARLHDWWGRTVRSLGPHEEIGLNSRVHLQGMTMHLPMVDTKGANLGALDGLSAFISSECSEVKAMRWFTSGRSFHGYGSGLLSDARWRYFMGTLLLYRHPQAADMTVDTRWVGHRLRDGYACLRLSWNTSAYVEQPRQLAPQHDRARPLEIA